MGHPASRRVLAALAVLLLLAATPVAAHGTLPGGGGFSAGFAHPFVAVDHLLVLIGLGGVLGRAELRRPLAGLLAGLAAGFALTLPGLLPPGLLPPVPMQPAILALALVTGLVLAAAVPLGAGPALALAAGSGLLIGADTDVLTGAAAAITASVAGVSAAVLVIVLNAMAVAQVAGRRMCGVPLRVAGSWIAAAAILVLALLARGMAVAGAAS